MIMIAPAPHISAPILHWIAPHHKNPRSATAIIQLFNYSIIQQVNSTFRFNITGFFEMGTLYKI
jgi:hypothetical protein